MCAYYAFFGDFEGNFDHVDHIFSPFLGFSLETSTREPSRNVFNYRSQETWSNCQAEKRLGLTEGHNINKKRPGCSCEVQTHQSLIGDNQINVGVGFWIDVVGDGQNNRTAVPEHSVVSFVHEDVKSGMEHTI